MNLPFRPAPMLRQDAFLTIILLTALTSAGSLYLNFLVVIIDTLQVGLGFSALDAGLVGSANLYGGAAGSLAAALLNRWINWRMAITIGIIALVLSDLASIGLNGLTPLMLVRFVHGIAGGIVVGAGFIVMSRTANPERTFGILLLVQVAESGLGVYLLPALVDQWGAAVPFAAMAIINLATMLVIPTLPNFPVPVEHAGTKPNASARNVAPMIAIAALAIFLHQMSRHTGGSFIFGIGSSFGFSREFISSSLGLMTWLAVLGTLGPVILANRFGRIWPVMIATAIGLIVSVLFIWGGHIPLVWWITLSVGGFVGMVNLPYFFGICSALDPSGRSSTWTAFFSKMGLAAGPTVGGLVLQETHFMRLLWVSAALLAISVALWLWPAMSLERARTQTEGLSN